MALYTKKVISFNNKNNDFVKPLLQGQQTPVSEGGGEQNLQQCLNVH